MTRTTGRKVSHARSTTLSEKIWDHHVVRRRRPARPALHRPAPRPRGHLAAGLRRARASPAARCAGPTSPSPPMDHNVPTADIDQPIADPISRKQIEVLRGQLRRVRHHRVPDGRSRPGHRARHRSRAGPDPAGHDHRVRRQPHLDARRVRRPRLRHRHERGRARARHPDAPPAAPGHDGGHRRRRPARRRDRQGRHARDHRPHRHRRRHRLGHRVPRLGHPRPVDGRPHDGVQHVDRGRRHAPGSIAPDDTTFAYLEGRPFAPTGAAWEQALDDWRSLPTDAGAAFDKEVVLDATHARARTCRWGTNPAQVVPIDAAVPDPDGFADADARESAAARARVHGPDGRHADARDPGRHRVHRLVHELRIEDLRAAADGGRGPHGARRACARSSCPVRSR